MSKREERQKRAFLGWVNYHLDDGGFPKVKSLQGFQSGASLLQLLEVLTGIELTRKGNMRPRIKAQEMDNLNIAFKFMGAEGIELVGIGSSDVWEGNNKLMMGLLWQIILFYQVFSGDDEQDSSEAAEEVLSWVNQRIAPFGVQVNDLTTSFADGKAFTALIASLDAGYDKSGVAATPSAAQRALKSAEERLAVPALVEAADLMDLDDKVVLTYLGMMHDKFGHLPPNKPAVAKVEHRVVRGTVRGRPQSLARPSALDMFAPMAAVTASKERGSAPGTEVPPPLPPRDAVSGAGIAREGLATYDCGYDGVATAAYNPNESGSGHSRNGSGAGAALPAAAAALMVTSTTESRTMSSMSSMSTSGESQGSGGSGMPPPPPGSAGYSNDPLPPPGAMGKYDQPPPPPPGGERGGSQSALLLPPGALAAAAAAAGNQSAGVSPSPSPGGSPRSKEVVVEFEDPDEDEDFDDLDVGSAEYLELKSKKRMNIDKLYFVIDYPRSRFRLGNSLTIEIRIKDNHGHKIKNHGSTLEAQIEGPSGLMVLEAEKVEKKLGQWQVAFQPSMPGLYLLTIVDHRKYIQNRWAKLKVTAPKKGAVCSAAHAAVKRPVFKPSASTNEVREAVSDDSGSQVHFQKSEGLGFRSFYDAKSGPQQKEQQSLRKKHEKEQAALENEIVAENAKREKAQLSEVNGHEAGITKELDGWRRREKDAIKSLALEQQVATKLFQKQAADEEKSRKSQLKSEMKSWQSNEKQRLKDELSQLKASLKGDKSALKEQTKRAQADAKLNQKYYPEYKQLRLAHELQSNTLLSAHELAQKHRLQQQELALEQLDARFQGQRVHMQKRHNLLKAQQSTNFLTEQQVWERKNALISQQVEEQKALDIAMHEKNGVAELADLKQSLAKKQKQDVKAFNIQSKELAKQHTKQLKQLQSENKKQGKSAVKQILADAKAKYESDSRTRSENFTQGQADELVNAENDLRKRIADGSKKIEQQHQDQLDQIRARHENNCRWLASKNEKDEAFLTTQQVEEVEALFKSQQLGQMNALKEHHKKRKDLFEEQMTQRKDLFVQQCGEKKAFFQNKIAEVEANSAASPVSDNDRSEFKAAMSGGKAYEEILRLEEEKFQAGLQKEIDDLLSRQSSELDDAKARV